MWPPGPRLDRRGCSIPFFHEVPLHDRVLAVALTDADRRRLFAVACLAMSVFGMVIAMLGTLFGLPEMRARLAIDLAQQGEVFGLLFVGLLAATVLAGPMLDRFGSKLVIVSAAAQVTAALVLFALARGFGAAAFAAVLLGFGGGWLNIGGNALVSDIYPENRGRMLNLLGIFFGVGALFVPLLVSVAFDALTVAGSLAACAAVAGACTLAAAPLHFPPAREATAFSFREYLRTARYPGVLLFASLLFFQSGNEAALAGWTSTYIGSVGWSPRVATVVLLGYWVMAIVGRSLSAWAQAALGKAQLVLLAGLVAATGCVVLLLAAGSLPVLAAGAWLTSIALSAVFPTTLAMAGDRYHRYAGSVFGFLFTIANFGGMLFPWALGQVSQRAGVRLGMVVPLVGTLAVAAIALAIKRTEDGTSG